MIFVNKYWKILPIFLFIDCFPRSEPVLILNRATQCYFNSGLQCIFATHNFIPWMTHLASKCDKPLSFNDKQIFNALTLLISDFNLQSLWVDNKVLFDEMLRQKGLDKNEQFDVIEAMNMILDALPQECNNPFIMNYTENSSAIEEANLAEKIENKASSIIQMESSDRAQTNLIDAFNRWFDIIVPFERKEKKYSRKTERTLTKFPTILCCGVTIMTTKEKIPLQSLSIPLDIYISPSLISESFILDTPSQSHYKLIGIAWRTAPDPLSATGHYFATVQYKTTWAQPGTWYILDEPENYTEFKFPYNRFSKEYDIGSTPPLDALKIISLLDEIKIIDAKGTRYQWSNQFINTNIFNQWLHNGFIQIDKDSKALPTLIIYEREMPQEEKKKQSEVVAKEPPQALSESLKQLQGSLAALQNAIKA